MQLSTDNGIKPAIGTESKHNVELLPIAHPMTPILSIHGVHQASDATEYREQEIWYRQVYQIEVEGLSSYCSVGDNCQEDEKREGAHSESHRRP